MRNFNDWADQLPKSYATRTNAERAWRASDGESDGVGSVVFYHRTDGRWSVVIVNPDPMFLAYYIHHLKFGVWK